MKQLLQFWLKFIALGLILYSFERILFIFHFYSDFKSHWGELFLIPYYALRLDFSAMAYTMALPFLVSIFILIAKSEKTISFWNRVIRVYLWLIFIIAALITAGEIVSYYEWQTKLSSKIWIHFTTPSEIFRTASGSYTYWFLFYFLIQLVFSWLIYHKLFKKINLSNLIYPVGKKIAYTFSYLLIGAFVFILGFRGGWQAIPVSATNAYYSDVQIVRDVTVNPIWNFINMSYTYLKVDLEEYFNNLSAEEAEILKAEMYANPNSDSTVFVLDTLKPNIILITLEGWSAQMIEPLGGAAGVTPFFNEHCKEGILFTEIYATGGTSETGHSSILSGYPTISGISISTESAKCRKLPSINQELEAVGYSTFYTFGGALSYGNIGGYLADIGFDKLVDENDLTLTPKGQLGIHDEAMFPYFLSEIEKAKRPYFYGIFTQSTHAPYDMPYPASKQFNGDGYVTSMEYADLHLHKFLESIKKLPDYENTLVIIVADHGKTNVINDDTYKEEFFHIPMLWWGGAISDSCMGITINKIASQADLAKTLLNQMKMDASKFHWSKDILNPYSPEWAICTSTLSYGIKDSAGYTVYQMIEDHLIRSAYQSDQETNAALNRCRAIMECMFREFKEL